MHIFRRSGPLLLVGLLAAATLRAASPVTLSPVAAASTASSTTAPVFSVTASFLETEPAIDGNLTDWPLTPTFVHAEAEVRIGWSPRALYLGVSVADGSLVSTRNSEMTSTDAVLFDLADCEIFLSSSRGNRPVYRRKKFGELDRTLFHRLRGPEGSRVAVRRVEDRGQVTYEAALPWPTISDIVSSGLAIPFRFRLRDLRGSELTETAFTPPGSRGQPADLVLELAPPGGSQVAVRPVARSAVVGPGQDPGAQLDFYTTSATVAPAVALRLDGQTVWSGDVKLGPGLTRQRVSGLALEKGAHNLEVVLPAHPAEALLLVVFDRAEVDRKLGELQGRLARWPIARAPGNVARSSATATWLATDCASIAARRRLTPVLASRCLTHLGRLDGILGRLEKNQTAWAGQTGLLRSAYRSGLDGTLQPYSLFVPTVAAGAGPRPLLLVLADINEDQDVHLEQPELQSAAQKHGTLVVAPFGRGLETNYRGPSRVDVEEVLADVRELFPVDGQRIYVAGPEAGGTAALELGLGHPDRYRGIAAANPVADEVAVFAKDWRQEPGPWLAMLLESCSPVTHTRNARGMPVFLGYQTGVTAAAREQGALLERGLRDAEAKVQVVALPAGAVSMAPLWEQALTFFDTNLEPRGETQVVYVNNRLTDDTAWWVRVEDVRVHGPEFAVRAERSRDGIYKTELQNVTALGLSTSGTTLVTGDKVDLTVDGQLLSVIVDEGNWIRIHRTQENWAAGPSPVATVRKRALLEGPIGHAYTRPFLYVYADKGPKATEVEGYARESARLWEQQYHGRVEVRAESKLTRADEAERNLILFGMPSSSTRAQEVLSACSIEVTTTGIDLGKTRFSGRTLGVQLVAPNPRNSERYLVLVTGNAAEALKLLVGHDWRKPDYFVVDPGYLEDAPLSAVGGGFFDRNWKP